MSGYSRLYVLLARLDQKSRQSRLDGPRIRLTDVHIQIMPQTVAFVSTTLNSTIPSPIILDTISLPARI